MSPVVDSCTNSKHNCPVHLLLGTGQNFSGCPATAAQIGEVVTQVPWAASSLPLFLGSRNRSDNKDIIDFMLNILFLLLAVLAG